MNKESLEIKKVNEITHATKTLTNEGEEQEDKTERFTAEIALDCEKIDGDNLPSVKTFMTVPLFEG